MSLDDHLEKFYNYISSEKGYSLNPSSWKSITTGKSGIKAILGYYWSCYFSFI